MYDDIEFDRLLNIKTSGRDDTSSNFMNFPYEATPYPVLELLVNSGYLSKNDKIIDFGCGKGRVSFFLSYMLKMHTIGIEFDLRLYNCAIMNKSKFKNFNRVNFFNIDAKDYIIDDDVTAFYFFNPFSYSILEEVLKNIKASIKRNTRKLHLFFYYPSREYLALLNDDKDISYIESIDCSHLFHNDSKEYIAIYKM